MTAVFRAWNVIINHGKPGVLSVRSLKKKAGISKCVAERELRLFKSSGLNPDGIWIICPKKVADRDNSSIAACIARVWIEMLVNLHIRASMAQKALEQGGEVGARVALSLLPDLKSGICFDIPFNA